MKKNMKRILPYLLVLSLARCGNLEQVEAREPVTIEEEGLEELSEEVGEEDLEEVVSYDELGSLFFKRGYQEETTLEDIILTNQERGILVEPTNFEKNVLSSMDLLSSNEQFVIDQLNVRRFSNILTSPVVTNKCYHHQNSSLYDKDSDDLKWDLLFDTLKANASSKLAYYQDKIATSTDEENRQYYESYLFEPFSDEDLTIWISQFQEFLTAFRKKVPNFDVQRLACLLEDYYVCYIERTDLDRYTYATTTSTSVEYPLLNGCHPDMEQFLSINNHEFRHIVNKTCLDEKDEQVSLSTTGIFLSSSSLYEEDFLEKYGIERGDFSCYFPYHYTFIEEANAEVDSSSLLGIEPSFYTSSINLLENIQLSLFLQSGFELDSFSKASALHNPLALLQQFPVYGETQEEQEDYFYHQLEMLEAYNILEVVIQDVLFNTDFEIDEDYEKIVERRQILERYADLQMYRNFYLNLVTARESHKSDMTLDDCYYLMRLFEDRIQMQRKFFLYNKGTLMSDEEFLTQKDMLTDFLLVHLLDVYGAEEFGRVGDYEEFDYWNYTLSDAFTAEEKEYFHGLVAGISQSDEWLCTSLKKTSEDCENEMKGYYKSY